MPVSPNTQICSIRIAFPVESDEQAIAYKKQLTAIFADCDSVRIGFDLTTVPMQKPKDNDNMQ